MLPLLLTATALASQPLSLSEALDATEAHSPTLDAVETQLDAARARQEQTWGLLLPMASAGMTGSHADHEDSFAFDLGIPGMDTGDPVVIRRQDDASGSLTVSMPLIDPQIWTGVAVTHRAATQVEHSVEDARQELLLATAQAWYAARMSASLVELQEAQVGVATEQLEVARAREAAGAGLRIDVVRAEADLAAARGDLLDARLALADAQEVLGMLTGLDVPVQPAGEPALPTLPGEKDAAEAQALSQRPDVAAAQAAVWTAQGGVASARSAYLPRVSAAWQGSLQLTEPTDMGSDDTTRWTAVAQVEVPLYSQARYGKTDEAKASLRQAELQLEDTRRQVELGARKALRGYETAQAAVEVSAHRAALADEALALTRAAYEAGAGSSLEVTEARRTASASQVDLIVSTLQADLAALEVLRAVGSDLGEL